MNAVNNNRRRLHKKRWALTYRGRQSLNGWLFISPWLLGFALFFAYPLGQSLYFAFSKVAIEAGGGYITRPVGFENFIYAFRVDTAFVPQLTSTLGSMAFSLPVIVISSLLLALLINQNFRGRTLVRSIFFLPVIIASGVIMNIIRQDVFAQSMQSGSEALHVFQSQGLTQVLERANLPASVIEYYTNIVSQIFDLLWKCGVQILLFLAGLQSINRSLYEAADVEGATAWEKFWRITVPVISPIILLCVVFTVIDSFTDYSNGMMQMIYRVGIVQMRYDYGTAIAWIYSICVFAVVGLIAALMSRFVIYQGGSE